MKHFRVDKLAGIHTLPIERLGQEQFEEIDMSSYSQKTFGMFSDTTTSVRIRFSDRLAGAVIDRFGLELPLIPETSGFFYINADIVISTLFYGWLFGLGPEPEIISPDSIRLEYRSYLEQTLQIYQNTEP